MNSERIMQPMDIEKKSFEIIESHISDIFIPDDRKDIVKRVIHTTADFDYIENLKFSDDSISSALKALKDGVTIVTDTNMAYSGINKTALAKLGGKAVCFMSDPDVAEEAKKREITRAAVSMEKACSFSGNLIFAIGNAPTALLELDRLIKEGKVNPSLIIGVPVGFVNVCESKEIIMESGVPYIVARGNKGGSNVAAAICNALIYKLYR
ncbi:MAG: precorrin-8X methylmutase [Oscillospiraceae bacterium]|nr:precorrin-8X methylmutase [Oscillospiraceae bacterium]